MATTEAAAPARSALRRNLSVWQAVGLSIALMAPSMAANINPQQTASAAGRAVPLSFVLSGLGVLFVAYGFVRLCQYYQHAGSVYAFVGATLGSRAGVVSGIGLLGVYTFFAVVTACAAGNLGTAFLSEIGIWPNPPSWGPYVLVGTALIGCWLLAVVPARRATSLLLGIEGATIALILLVTVVIAVRLISGTAPTGKHFTLSVFTFAPGTGASGVFLGAVFGFLSFGGFEAAATLGEETNEPRRAIPRAILGTAIFGGIYFVVVTAIEMMAFGTDQKSVANFVASPSLLGQLSGSYASSWVGDLISIGAAISAFGCCLASIVGASRLLFALGRDAGRASRLSSVTGRGTPAVAATWVAGIAAGIIVLCGARLPRDRDRHVRLVRHDRHADPADHLRARHARRGAPGVLPAQDGRAMVADRVPDRRDRAARLHRLRQRRAVSDQRRGQVVPGDLGRDSAGRAGVRAAGAEGGAAGRRRVGQDGRCDMTEPPLIDHPLIDHQLIDHHCHGLVTKDLDRVAFEELLTEADTVSPLGTSLFDSLIGLAVRRWCAPVLDLPAHAPAEDYLARRVELGAAEVNRRLLRAAGIDTFLVDDGFRADELTTVDELGALADARAERIIRLEAVAEQVLARTDAEGFADALRAELAAQAVHAVGCKSIVAYRFGLELAGERPTDKQVRSAVGAWQASGSARLAHPMLHRFLIWTGIDLRLPVQFHVGYGDRDVHLRRADPLLLTELLRATESAGVPILLLHNYPFHRNAGYLAQVFSHVFVDVGLATHNVGARASTVLAELLELAPFGKVLFSSDAFGLAECYHLGSVLFRRALAEFLRAAEVPAGDADRIVGLLARDNAERVYQLAPR